MTNHRTSKIVGIVGMAVGVFWLAWVVVIPYTQGILAGDWRLFSLFFGLLISIPAMLLIRGGYQLTKESNRDNIKRTIGCLCIVSVYLCYASLLSDVPKGFHRIWLSWGSLIAMVVGIGLYAIACNKLLQHEGFNTHLAEFFGESQLSVLALLLWMALSSINEDFRDDTLLVELASLFGPIVTAVVFFKVSRRFLTRWQQQSETSLEFAEVRQQSR